MNVDATFWIEPDDEWRASLHPARTTDYGSEIPATCHLRPGSGSSIVVQSVEAADRLIAVLTEAREFLALHEVVDAEIVDEDAA